MMFEFTRRRGARSPVTDAPTFRVRSLKEAADTGHRKADFSHLIDRSYDYHSARELRWHLAERLGLAPATLTVREAA